MRLLPTFLLGIGCLFASCREHRQPSAESAPSEPAIEGIAGAPGLGDPLYPQMGNAGYDALHYTVALKVEPAANHLAASVTLRARAHHALSSLNLDFHGLNVLRATQEKREIPHRRDGDELTLELSPPVPAGDEFTVTVEYEGSPRPVKDPAVGFTELGWQTGGDSILAVSEPSGTKNWIPCNDHPSDKATYSFRIDTPAALTAVANGRHAGTTITGDRATHLWG